MRGRGLRHVMRGVFKKCDEPRLPHEGAHVRIYDEPETPNIYIYIYIYIYI